ncbi:FAD:protein FMN transferase, partial [Lactococcus cremoris]
MMGTTIDLLIEDDQADLKLEIACQLLDIYNKRFSANDSESELSQINHQAGLKPVQIHPELFELIKIGKKESLSTPSNLNIALGPVTQAWHIGFPDAKLPDSQEIQKLLLLSNPEMIILDEENLTVFLQQSCYLSDLAVHRDYQSRKVGATLIEHVEKEL